MQLGGREAHKTVKRVDFRGLGVHKESDGLHTRGELRAHGGGFDRGNAAQAFLVEIESEHVRASVAGGFAEFGEIVVRAKTGFADGNAGVGNALNQVERGFDAKVQSFQVAIVDADDASFSGERSVELGGSVHLDEGLHFQL